jgi:uncharacterized protein YndB with AHSA1/START domain
MYGSYVTIEGTPTLNFERRLSYPVDRVWRAITDPGDLRHWFPSAVEADLRVGGAMKFTFEEHVLPDGSSSMPGEVTDLDAPRLFGFTWGPPTHEDHLRFELEPDNDTAPRSSRRGADPRRVGQTNTRRRKFRSPSHRKNALNPISTG